MKKLTAFFQSKTFKKITLMFCGLFYFLVIFIAFQPEPFLCFGYLGVFTFNLFGPGTILVNHSF